MSVLHATVRGEGQPLCILHGFLGMSDNWRTLGNQFAENGFEVHMIDQRNHGRSFHSAHFSYKLMAEDLKDYLDHHKLENIQLLGHSMGGKTAMKFAVQNQERVNSLIVADIGPKYYPPHHQHIIDALLKLNVGSLTSRREADERLSQWLSDNGMRLFLLKNLYRKSEGGFAFRCNLQVLQNKLDEIGVPLSENEKFNGRTLFVRGGNSDYILEEDLEQIAHHFPDNALETIENTGHWLHAENPKRFFQICLGFFDPV